MSNIPTIGRSTLRKMFKLELHNLDPKDFYPNGDRYVVERIEVDENVMMGTILVAVGMGEDGMPIKPGEEPKVERRGVFPAVIHTVGNGHLLGLPDWATTAASPSAPLGIRSKADVPMFFHEGDIVLVDVNAKGRNLRIAGAECRIVNQIDILASIPKVRLKRSADGGWEQVEETSSHK